MTPRLPDHALPFLGPAAGVDWSQASWHTLALAGLQYGGVATIGTKALLLTADLDVDIDGPGGALVTDPYWQPATSLRTAAGVSCDSREFPGYVMSPALRDFGVRLGDFGFAVWGGRMEAFQVYDTGPLAKAGEGSIRLARDLGLVQPHESDHLAAHGEHQHSGVTDVAAIIFPRSAPGTGETVANHALPALLIERAAHTYWLGLRALAA